MNKRIRINGNLYESVEDSRTKSMKDWWEDLNDLQEDLAEFRKKVLSGLKGSDFSKRDQSFYKDVLEQLNTAHDALLDVGMLFIEIEPKPLR